MPKMQNIWNLFLLVGRDEYFLGGTLVLKSKKYVNKNIRCNIWFLGKKYKLKLDFK
jgi:hypothetical protein